MAPELHSRQPLEMFPVLPRPTHLHTPSPPTQQHTTSMPCTPLHRLHLLTDRTSTRFAHLPKLHLRWRAHRTLQRNSVPRLRGVQGLKVQNSRRFGWCGSAEIQLNSTDCGTIAPHMKLRLCSPWSSVWLKPRAQADRFEQTPLRTTTPYPQPAGGPPQPLAALALR